MESPIHAADRLAAALVAADVVALGQCLDARVCLVRLGKRFEGRDAVLMELCENPIYRDQVWQPAVAPEPGVRLIGHARASGGPGLVLTLHWNGSRFARLEQQRIAPPPPPAAPLALPATLTRLIDSALEQQRPMLLAYADAHGQPVLSFRGSVQVLDPSRLSMWIRRADGGFIRAIAVNPRVALMLRDEKSRATYQFQGRASVVDDPLLRDRIYCGAPTAEREHDFARLGVAVVVELDRVEGYAGVGPSGQIDRLLLIRNGGNR